MPDKLIFKKDVAVAAVWENLKKSKEPFWRVVAQDGARFTAWSRDLISGLIEGREPRTVNDSIVYNIKPPVNMTLFFSGDSEKGLVLEKQPAGEVEEAPANAGQPAPGAGQGQQSFGNRSWGKSAGKEWKPEDKRPSLVTMSESYAKDIVAAIVSHNADLSNMDPANVITWARDNTIQLSRAFLENALAELKKLGFKVDPGEGAAK